MLIRCPKCQVCYRIEETLLAKGSRKLRCAKCEEVWEAKPEDCFEEQDVSEEEVYDLSGASANTPENESPAEDNKQEDNKQETDSLFKIRESGGQLDAENATIPDEEPAPSEEEAKPASEEAQVSENDKEEKIDEKDLALGSDMQQIFSRLNKQNELIEEMEKNTSALKKASEIFKEKFWQNTGLRNGTILTLLGLIILSLLSFRYELVRKFPKLEEAYTALGLQSRIIGEGLEFQNVSHREYEEDYVKKMEIKGFIINRTDKKQQIPDIKVEVLDKDGITLQKVNTKTPIAEIWPRERAAFSFIVTQPSPLSKYVYLTFGE